MASRLIGFVVLGLVICSCKPKVSFHDRRSQNHDHPNCHPSQKSEVISFKLTTSDPSSKYRSEIDTALKSYRKELASGVEVRVLDNSIRRLGRLTHANLEFLIREHKVCNVQAKLSVFPNGAFKVVGDQNVKSIDFSQVLKDQDLSWNEDDLKILAMHFATTVNKSAKSVDLFASEACVLLDREKIRAYWDLSLRFGSKSYKGTATMIDGKPQMLTWADTTFNLTGEAKIFPRRKVSGELITVELNNLKTGGYLCSQYLNTRTLDLIPYAHSNNAKFNYAPSDPEFKEVSAYANASNMQDWFHSIGLLPKKSDPLSIHLPRLLRVGSGSGFAGPEYQVEGGNHSPVILLPEQLPNLLKNFQITPDAISHEVAHHYITDYLDFPRASADLAALHEGLADAFVLLRFKDSCLGPKICVEDADLCFIEDTCLRTAEADIKFNNSESLTSHRRGQLVSGVIWDIAKAHTFEFAEELLVSSMSLIPNRPDFADFLKTLTDVAFNLEESDKIPSLCTIFKNKGFTTILPARCI